MDVFIARQPIFDRGLSIAAYELLFRGGPENAFAGANGPIDGTLASSHVMRTSLVTFGLEELAQGHPVFVNVTAELLHSDLLRQLPPDRVVLEILEDIPDCARVIAACRELKRLGFTVAVDDIERADDRPRLQQLADIIKVDLFAADATERMKIARQAEGSGARLLAEKVESYEEYRQLADLGYDLFQGFFFSRPEVMSRPDAGGNKLSRLRLLQQLYCAELSLDGLERVIREDASLAYRLLRYINSSYFAWRVEIQAIRQALVMLGDEGVRRWATLVTMAELGEDKPSALIRASLERALFCEMAARRRGRDDRASSAFLVGLLSLLDALLDRPLDEALADIPLADDVRAALQGEATPLRHVLELVVAYERADWNAFERSVTALELSEEEADAIPDAYRKAVESAEKSLEALAE